MSRYKNLLVTGGAGFVGSFLVDRLISLGYNVRILDNLESQVHFGNKPKYLNKRADFIKGDVRDKDILNIALNRIDAIFHLASVVGVSQSNYQIKRYIDSNILGSANLLECLVSKNHKIKKFITISSMTSYGEGSYLCNKCGIVRPSIRNEEQLIKRDWDLYCPVCNNKVEPVAIDEFAPDFPNSIYGFTKKSQQDMALLIGKLYNIPTVVLRGFNIYGPRQSLSNPYTGVTAIFISRLKNNKPVIIFEDGLQTRDFISVHDVVNAFVLSLTSNKANYQIFNIGSGKKTTILKIAQILSKLLGKEKLIKLSQKYRKNDIRNCFADISKAQKLLGWKPTISLEYGLKELVQWSDKEKSEDRFEIALKELKESGMQN